MLLPASGTANLMAPGFSTDIPKEFSSLEEARNSLDYQTNGIVHFFKDAENKILSGMPFEAEIESSRNYWSKQLADWDVAFKAFMNNPNTMLNQKSQQAAWSLRIHQRMGSMHLRPRTSLMLADEFSWELYLQDYEDIVSSAEAIVALDEIRRGTSENRKIEFSLDISLVSPVFAAAHKCREPNLRRRAIALLKKAQRQEGLWDSTIAARVAERIAAIEQDAVGDVTKYEGIPMWARVVNVSVNFDKQERKGQFTYSRASSLEQPVPETFQETFQETIYW